MSGSIVTFPRAHIGRRPAAATLLARAREFAAHMVQEWRVRRALAELQGLNPRGLHDIGLTSSSAESAIRHRRSGRDAADGMPSLIRETPECPPMPSSWTEWR